MEIMVARAHLETQWLPLIKAGPGAGGRPQILLNKSTVFVLGQIQDTLQMIARAQIAQAFDQSDTMRSLAREVRAQLDESASRAKPGAERQPIFFVSLSEVKDNKSYLNDRGVKINAELKRN